MRCTDNGPKRRRLVAPLMVPLWPDAGQALGLKRGQTYDRAKDGTIPTKRYGKLLRVPAAWLAQQAEVEGN
jgi:hypothetical protein